MTNNSSKLYYPNEYYAQLLFYAKSDLEWAKSKLERTNYFYHKPCSLRSPTASPYGFEARECVEKSLKAFLEASGKAAPELHSSLTLIDLCGQVDKEFLRLRSKCLILQPYQHEARYPELPTYNFTQDMADEAIDIATEIYETVEQKIAQIQQKATEPKD